MTARLGIGGWGRRLAAGLAFTAGVAAASIGTAPSAEAWAWDPHVILNGRVSCPAYGGPYDRPTWMWVSGNTGDSGWATLGSGGTTKPYVFDMRNVPAWRAEWVTVSYGCSVSGRHTTSFGVSRPSSGIYATRNIY